jgi:hypothetical protein
MENVLAVIRRGPAPMTIGKYICITRSLPSVVVQQCLLRSNTHSDKSNPFFMHRSCSAVHVNHIIHIQQ